MDRQEIEQHAGVIENFLEGLPEKMFHLGIRVVLAKSFARIHRANLINFGILPLTFVDCADYDMLNLGGILQCSFAELVPGGESEVVAGSATVRMRNDLSAAELETIRSGGLLNKVRADGQNSRT